MNRPSPRRPWRLGDVTLAVRQDGRWRVRWPGADGRLQERTFGRSDWPQAKEFAHDVARDFQQHGPSAASRLERRTTPWAEVLDRWLQAKAPDWSPSVRDQHAGLLRKWALPRLGDLPIGDVMLEHYQLVLADIAAAGRHGSRARVRTLLAQLEGWAAASGYIEPRRFPVRASARPAAGGGVVGADGPGFVEPTARPDTLRVEHLITTLREVARTRPNIELQARVSAYSGLRLGETFALRTCHLEEGGRTIAVRWQYVSEPGTMAVLKRPKNGKVRVALLLPSWADLITAARSRSRPAANPPCPDCETPDTCSLLFPAPNGGPDVADNFRDRVANPAFEATRDAPTELRWPQASNGRWRWTWHSLRHHAAVFHVDTLKLGVADTATLLGHTPKVLMERYYGTSAGVVERAAAAAAAWTAGTGSPTSR